MNSRELSFVETCCATHIFYELRGSFYQWNGEVTGLTTITEKLTEFADAPGFNEAVQQFQIFVNDNPHVFTRALFTDRKDPLSDTPLISYTSYTDGYVQLKKTVESYQPKAPKKSVRQYMGNAFSAVGTVLSGITNMSSSGAMAMFTLATQMMPAAAASPSQSNNSSTAVASPSRSLPQSTYRSVTCELSSQVTQQSQPVCDVPPKQSQSFLLPQGESALARFFGYGELGSGNEASTIALCKQLRAMGFTGKVELIYPKESKKKFAALYGFDENFNDYQVDENHNVTFISLDEFLKRKAAGETANADLVLAVGGDANPCAVPSYLKIMHLLPKDRPGTECNPAAIFQGPSLRFVPYIAFDRTHNTIFNLPLVQKEIQHDNSYLRLPHASFKDAMEFLETDPTGIRFSTEKPGLKLLIDKMKEGDINFQSIYGRTLFYVRPDVPNSGKNAASINNLLQTIMVTRSAQLTGPKSFGNKPIVMMFFHEAPYDIKDIIHPNSQLWKDFEKEDRRVGSRDASHVKQAREKLSELDLNDSTFNVIDLKDENAVAQLQQLKPRTITLVITGKMPQTLFEGLFTHTARYTLPPVTEGAKNINNLLAEGKLFFVCNERGSWQLGNRQIEDQALGILMSTMYGPNGFCTGPRNWENQNLIASMGKLIIESLKKSSPCADFYKKLKEDAENPNNDRALNALHQMKIMSQEEDAQPSAPSAQRYNHH